MDYTTKAQESDVTAAQAAITAVAQGAKSEGIFGEQLTSLECPQLLAQLKSADAALAKTPKNQGKRLELVLAYAMYRDARYGFITRRFLQGHGMHNAQRSLYGLGMAGVTTEEGVA